MNAFKLVLDEQPVTSVNCVIRIKKYNNKNSVSKGRHSRNVNCTRIQIFEVIRNLQIELLENKSFSALKRGYRGKQNDSGVRKYACHDMRLHSFDMFDWVSNVGRNMHDGEHIRYNCAANGRSSAGLYSIRINICFTYFTGCVSEDEASRTRPQLNHRLLLPRKQFVCTNKFQTEQAGTHFEQSFHWLSILFWWFTQFISRYFNLTRRSMAPGMAGFQK